MNVFKEMALSVYSYGSYSKFLQNKKGKVFGFGVLLITIYFILTMIIPAVLPPGSIINLGEKLRQDVPDFRLVDGTLWVDEVTEMDTGSVYLYVNTTSGQYVDYSAKLREAFHNYRTVLLIDSEKIIMKDDLEWTQHYFSDLDVDFAKEDLEQFIPWLYLICTIFLIVAFFWMTAWFFFGVLIVALLGLIIAAGMQYRLSFGQLYLMGIYSRTLPLLIKAIVSFLPFGIPFFWILNFGLSAFILAMAIRKMKEQDNQNMQNAQNIQPF